MSEHAKLSPSSAHRWMRCPGSIKLSEGIPDESSEYADRGTFAHEIAADCLLALDPDECLREHVRGETQSVCGRFAVDDEMVDAITLYINAVRATCNLLGRAQAMLVEQRVVIVPDVVWGTADCIVTFEDELHVFDFKYGSGVYVEVENNEQLKTYALGGLKTLKDSDRFQRIVTHIVQPRHQHPRWRFASYDIDDLFNFNDELHYAVSLTEETDPKLEAGDHCKFCPAKLRCPALRDASLGAATQLFAPRPQPPAPTEMTPEDIGKALTIGERLVEWLGAVRQHAYELAKTTDIPGWKLVQKTGARRQWHDEAEAEKALRALGAEPMKTKLCSPAQAEKLPGVKKADVAKLAFQPDAGTTLVPTDDKRAALSRVQFTNREE